MNPAICIIALWSVALTGAAAAPLHETAADKLLADYFKAETTRLEQRCLTRVDSLEDWTSKKQTYREQLFEMLGLKPLPDKTDLKPVVVGRVEQEDFTVENIQLQTMPGLFIAANLYLPKNTSKPSPAILYVSGHGPVITNGISYGNKVSYQHHGEWFARNGYVCLVLDTVQWGELLGVHHGTYSQRMWWWNSRGYTPAGVEAWNSIRALDYLATRPEVDADRFGVTGRSGGGAYSWWVAALDDRIKAAAPVAGITDLHNHVIDGTVEGHCDCMFMVNTYRWDYPQVAALVAPRPLMIVNTDNDSIFPLDGVERLHWKVRSIYELYHANSNLALMISTGPHKDTQDLQVPVFRWFNRHLKNADPLIEMAAVPLLKPEQLRVFTNPPPAARTTNIHDTFVPMAAVPEIPQSASQWKAQREKWLAELEAKTFAGWPETNGSLRVKKAFAATRQGLRLQAWDFQSQDNVSLRLYTLQRSGWFKPARVELTLFGTNGLGSTEAPLRSPSFTEWVSTWQPVFGEDLREEGAGLSPQGLIGVPEKRFEAWKQWLQTNNATVAFLAPRGLGLNAWSGNDRKLTQVRRRFMLLGQTLDGMRVWDIRCGVQALATLSEYKEIPVWLSGKGEMASDALLAALFESKVARVDLYDLAETFQKGADYLNILRILDVPQVTAMVAENALIRLHGSRTGDWLYPRRVVSSLNWKSDQFTED